MRVHAYPENNVVFIGTKTHVADLSDLPHGLIEFDTADTEHPVFGRIKHLVSAHCDYDVVESGARRRGLCWATNEIVDGHRVNVFHFDHAGDQLPWHTHDEHTVHTSEVIEGSFEMLTDDGPKIIAKGDFIDWDVGQWHGFIALEAGSLLRNRVKPPIAHPAKTEPIPT